MLNIGPQELLIILVIALLVVGPQRLPALGRSIGRGLRELRKAQDEVKRTIQVNLDDEPSNGRARPAHPPTSDRPRSDPGTGPSASAPTGEAVPSPAPEPTPTASEPLPANEIREISRSLGRSLSELRRAKEEVQRSFRIDQAAPASRPAPSRPPGPPPASEPAAEDPSATDAVSD
jgi:sec-independent protein translocase protein TatA